MSRVLGSMKSEIAVWKHSQPAHVFKNPIAVNRNLSPRLVYSNQPQAVAPSPEAQKPNAKALSPRPQSDTSRDGVQADGSHRPEQVPCPSTDNVLEVPYYNYSIIFPKTLF